MNENKIKLTTKAGVRCVDCRKRIFVVLPKHIKGTQHVNTIQQINNNLPAGWTYSAGSYRCEECS